MTHTGTVPPALQERNAPLPPGLSIAFPDSLAKFAESRQASLPLPNMVGKHVKAFATPRVQRQLQRQQSVSIVNPGLEQFGRVELQKNLRSALERGYVEVPQRRVPGALRTMPWGLS